MPRAVSSLPAVPRWGLLPAVAAPLAMIGGWSLAQALQPAFNPVTETISALATAERAAPDVLGAALVLTGLAHVGTAAALRPLRPAARLALALGGLGTLAVGLLPVDRFSLPHGIAAGTAFAALALWPALAARRSGHGVERPAVALAATAGLGALVLVFVTLLADGDPTLPVGLTERLASGAQALWPLVVVLRLLALPRRPPGP